MHLLALILRHPLRTLWFGYSFATQTLLLVLKALLLPHLPRYQSLRLQIHKAFLISSSLTFPELPHRLPVTSCRPDRARRIGGSTWTGYVIPGYRILDGQHNSGRKPCVVLYAHGGGYARGEARMYLNYMERWIREAAEVGVDLVFVSVEYPLSTEAPHPAQRNAFVAAYKSLLEDEGLAPGQILLMGDSAGGGLCTLSAVEMKLQGLPQPAGVVLISPWIDMSLRVYNDGGNALVESDYLVHGNTLVPFLTKLWLGGQPGTAPDTNPLCCKPEEMSGLAPHLIFVGGGEFVLQDSKELSRLLEMAGVRHELVVEWGQLHIYAMGSRFLEPEVRRKTDAKIVGWMKQCIDT